MKFPKVYEYVDEEGNTYWSFALLRSKVTQGRHLVLQDRVGRYLIQFLHDLRKEWKLFAEPSEPPEDLGV